MFYYNPVCNTFPSCSSQEFEVRMFLLRADKKNLQSRPFASQPVGARNLPEVGKTFCELNYIFTKAYADPDWLLSKSKQPRPLVSALKRFTQNREAQYQPLATAEPLRAQNQGTPRASPRTARCPAGPRLPSLTATTQSK